jgi:hypothetical protein
VSPKARGGGGGGGGEGAVAYFREKTKIWPRESVLPMILDSMLWCKPSSITGTICLIRILFFILLTRR